MIEKIKKCRNCGGKVFLEVASYGNIYPSNFVQSGNLEIQKAPMDVVECVDCHLVQLLHNYDSDEAYKQYWYCSSLNKSMVKSLVDIVQDIESRVSLSNRVVVDIGANDGTLLSLYQQNPVFTVGFDPALNLKKLAEKKCDLFINDYFTAAAYPLYRKATLITCVAMFYDIPDITSFMNDVVSILAHDGMLVIQLTDLYSMVKINAIDNLCAEHVEYYTLEVLSNIMREHGLVIHDCSYNNVNGGSLRIFASFPGKYKVQERVYKSILAEQEYFALFTDHPLKELAEKVKFEAGYLTHFLQLAKQNNKKCFVLGASTKGNTLLQLWKIGSDLIPYALEVNKEKYRLMTVGSNIRIISEEQGMEMKPDYLLVLPWHFRTFFIEKFKDYLDNGGHLVFPLPRFEIV